MMLRLAKSTRFRIFVILGLALAALRYARTHPKARAFINSILLMMLDKLRSTLRIPKHPSGFPKSHPMVSLFGAFYGYNLDRFFNWVSYRHGKHFTRGGWGNMKAVDDVMAILGDSSLEIPEIEVQWVTDWVEIVVDLEKHKIGLHLSQCTTSTSLDNVKQALDVNDALQMQTTQLVGVAHPLRPNKSRNSVLDPEVLNKLLFEENEIDDFAFHSVGYSAPPPFAASPHPSSDNLAALHSSPHHSASVSFGNVHVSQYNLSSPPNSSISNDATTPSEPHRVVHVMMRDGYFTTPAIVRRDQIKKQREELRKKAALSGQFIDEEAEAAEDLRKSYDQHLPEECHIAHFRWVMPMSAFPDYKRSRSASAAVSASGSGTPRRASLECSCSCAEATEEQRPVDCSCKCHLADSFVNASVESLSDSADSASESDAYSPSSHIPVVIHLAATGQEGLDWRADSLGAPLAVDHNIGSIVLENPFYGRRKPKESQGMNHLFSVEEILKMSGTAVDESTCILHWLQKQGYDKLGLCGISMGATVSGLAASSCRLPVAVCAFLPSYSGTCVYTEGVMYESVDWERLRKEGNQLFGVRTHEECVHTLARLTRCSDVTLQTCPARPDAAVLIAAVDDGYVPTHASVKYSQHWPGSELRWIPGGHVSGFIFHIPEYIKGIADAFDRL